MLHLRFSNIWHSFCNKGRKVTANKPWPPTHSYLHWAAILITVRGPKEKPFEGQLDLLVTLAFRLTSHGLQALSKAVLLQLHVFRYVIQNLGSVVARPFAPSESGNKRTRNKQVFKLWEVAHTVPASAVTKRKEETLSSGTTQSHGHCSQWRQVRISLD